MANTEKGVFVKMTEQLPDLKDYDREMVYYLSWMTLKNPDGYKI